MDLLCLKHSKQVEIAVRETGGTLTLRLIMVQDLMREGIPSRKCDGVLTDSTQPAADQKSKRDYFLFAGAIGVLVKTPVGAPMKLIFAPEEAV